MQIVRYRTVEAVRWGIDHGDKIVELSGDGSRGEQRFPVVSSKSDVVMLPPCVPRQIVCVALNYRSVAEALKVPEPTEPVFFLKSLGSLITSGAPILLPSLSNDVVQEAELAIVLRHDLNRADFNTASDAIGGYTIANDVTARDIQMQGGTFLRTTVSKSFESFFPCGPSLETDLPDLADRLLECRINGVKRQSALLGDMIFPPSELISRLSHMMQLYRGDVIATGTPLGYSQIDAGDTVEISIEGLQSLSNPVQRAKIITQ